MALPVCCVDVEHYSREAVLSTGHWRASAKASAQLNDQELKYEVYSVIYVLACGPVFSAKRWDDPNKIRLEIRWLPEVPPVSQCDA